MKANGIAIITTVLITVPAYLMCDDAPGLSFLWVCWLLLALIPASMAYKKGRNFFLWLLYGMFLWLIAMIHSIAISDNDKAKKEKGWRKCPYCGEYSRPEATVCHCCGREL